MTVHLVSDLVLLLSLIRCLLASNSTNSSNETKDKERIINGEQAKEGEFPYVVHLKFDQSMCTGMIIDEVWVLTAAHCIHGANTAKVFAGGVNYKESTQNTVTVRANKIIVHPCYDAKQHLSDVALVRVETPFDFSGCCIRKGTLTGGQFPEVKSMSCMGVGFGKTTNDESVNKQLHKLPIEASVLEECFRKTPYIYELFNMHPHAYREETGQRICAEADEGKGMCYGDSGGPLVCRGLLAGVLSYNGPKIKTTPFPSGREDKPKCATPNKYSGYMFTGHFMEWIQHHVPNLTEPGILSTGSSVGATACLVTVTLGVHFLKSYDPESML